MAATNRKAPVKRAAVNGHANGNRSYVVLELSSEDVVSDERIPLFSIDGTEYTMPAEVPGYVGLEATDLWATQGEAVATRWLMMELLGAGGVCGAADLQDDHEGADAAGDADPGEACARGRGPKSPLTVRCEQVAWVRDHLDDLASATSPRSTGYGTCCRCRGRCSSAWRTG